jgi:TRAP-type transport system small permease protein
MSRLQWANNSISAVSSRLGAWLVIAMIPLVLFEVLTRYIFRQPLMVADEFSAYMFVILSFIGLGYTWKSGGHIRVVFVTTKMPVKISRWLRVVILAMCLAYCIMINIESYGFLVTSFERHLRSSSWLRTPLQGPHIAVVIGYIFLTVALITEIVQAVSAAKSASDGERGRYE